MSNYNKKDAVDYVKFGGAFTLYAKGIITQVKMAEMVGVSTPTLCKYMEYWYLQLNEKIMSGEIKYLDYGEYEDELYGNSEKYGFYPEV